MTQNTASFQIHDSQWQTLELFLKQKIQVWFGFWQNVGTVVKIEKILKTTEKDSLANENQPWETDQKNVIKIDCVGNFEDCGSQSVWNLAMRDFITPEIWRDKGGDKEKVKTENLITQKWQNSLKTENYPNENLEKANEKKFKIGKIKYNFIPTVQNNEKVIAGQKLGFVENNGNLFWLIVPNYEAKYQVQITSGEFEIDQKIGELIGSQNFEINLKQTLKFDLIKTEKFEKMWNCNLLFDFFCPVLVGSRVFLDNFDKESITNLITNIAYNNQQKNEIVFVSDLNLQVPLVNFFGTTLENCLALSQYFVLCGFQVILVVQSPLNWQNSRNFFGNFITPNEEMASLTLFYVNSQKENSQKTQPDLALFHNFWTNLEVGTEQNKKIKLPNLQKSWTKNKFEEILKKNLNQQNSVLVNQGSTSSGSFVEPTKVEISRYLQNPTFQLLFSQNSQSDRENCNKLLDLWNFWLWLDNYLEYNPNNLEIKNQQADKIESLIKKVQNNQITIKKAKEEIENWS